MGRFSFSALIGAALFATPAATVLAADFPEPPPYVPPPVEIGHQWYLRGHIGMSAQHFGGLSNVSFATATNFRWLDTGNFDSAPIFGVGIGFKYNDNFRFDLTGEYRGKAAFAALDAYDAGGGAAAGTNDYTAKKSEWLVLANAYWDIGTWKGVTPYIGAGIGASLNTISDFRDINVPNGGVAYGATASQLNFAWALHAGASVEVTDKLTLDVGYSFTYLGNAHTGDLIAFDGTNTTVNPMSFNGIYSHDLKIGARWAFDQNTPDYPVIAKY